MVFWKRELRELEASGHRFEDIFRIFSTEFTDTPFSLQFTAGQTQRMSYAELTALASTAKKCVTRPTLQAYWMLRLS